MRPTKKITLLFLFTLLAYLTAFTLIEHRRKQNGPWQITFTATHGAPTIIIIQPKLKIQNVRIIFPGEQSTTNAPQTIAFDTPQPVPFPVPFGQCIFFDALFLPGTVTLQLYGHEIQLLPRVLTVDNKEIPWQAGITIPIRYTNETIPN